MRNICSEMFDALGASATASAEEMYQAACKVRAQVELCLDVINQHGVRDSRQSPGTRCTIHQLIC